MSGNIKKTRSVSEETAMRQLLVDLTDKLHVMVEEHRADMIVIRAKFEAIDIELRELLVLGRDVQAKANDLHHKLLDQANGLGRRIHDLEEQRGKKTRPSRPPGRR